MKLIKIIGLVLGLFTTIAFSKDGLYRPNSNVTIPYATVDSTSTSTKFTATVEGIDHLETGTMVMLNNNKITSASGFTLNINGLGAKPVYHNLANATSAAKLFAKNYTMIFVYDADRVSGGCWIFYEGYTVADTDKIGYQLRGNYNRRVVSDVVPSPRLLFSSPDNTQWVPSNTDTSTVATVIREVNQQPINPFGRIIYYSSTTALASNALAAAAYCWDQYTLTLGTSFNRTDEALVLDYHSPVYIKCTPQSDTSAIIDAETPYVQELPSEADGKIYIYLGHAYSETAIELLPAHPVYYHDGTGIKLWIGGNDYISKAELREKIDQYRTDEAETVFGSIDRANAIWTILHDVSGEDEPEPVPIIDIGKTTFNLSDEIAETYDIHGNLNNDWLVANGFFNDNSYKWLKNIENVVIGTNVTKLGVSTFMSCKTLTNVIIPNSVSNIDNYAFTSCTNLQSLTFIDNNDCTTGIDILSGCNNLSTIYYTHMLEESSSEVQERLKDLLSTSTPALDWDNIDFIDISLYPEKLGDMDPNEFIYTVGQVENIFAKKTDIPDITDLEKIKQAIDYETEVGTIEYEERNGELWVTNAIANENRMVKIPAYKDGKPVRGIKYNATFTNADLAALYFYGTELEVLRHDKIENGKTVLDYYEHPNWSIFSGGLDYVHMPFVKEIPDWYFLYETPVGYNEGFGAVYFPNVEKIGSYAFANSGFYKEGTDVHGDDVILCTISFPSLKFVGANAFIGTKARNVYVPELLEMDASTFGSEVTNLYAPKVRIVRGITSGTSTNNPNFRLPFQTNSCFKNIEKVYLPSCEEIGNNVFHFEDAVDTLDKPKSVYLPKCKRVGDDNWFFNVSYLYMPECVDWNGRFIKGSYVERPEKYFRRGDQQLEPNDKKKRKNADEFEPNNILKTVCLGTRFLNDNAFRGCIALQVAEFPNLEMGADWSFAGCTNLLYFDAPKMTHGADYMFYNCRKLGYGNFPELLDTGIKMFSGCSNIRKILNKKQLNGYNFDLPTYTYNTESSSWNLVGNYDIIMPTNVIYPENPTNSQLAIVSFEKYVTKKIEPHYNWTIYLPKVQYIGNEAFRAYDPFDYTPAMTNITTGEGDTLTTNIVDATWQVSGNLGVVDLPTVKEIGPSAFRGQRRLWSLNIPKCELIDKAAFYRCGSIIEDEITNEEEHVSHPLGKDRQFNLPNVRRIESTAFAHTRFGYTANRDGEYPWWGMTINAPNVTYIAPDAFKDTWKILDIYAPLWAHDHSLFEYKYQFDWGHRSQTGEHSLTNAVWLGYEHEKDYLGDRVNLWQKMGVGENDGILNRTYDLKYFLPESYCSTWTMDVEQGVGKTAYTIGPFTNNENEILTLSFKAAPICTTSTGTNTLDQWTVENAYRNDSGIVTVKIFEDGVNTKTETFNLRKNPLSDSPWIKFSKHDRGEGAKLGPWYGYDIINEPKEISVKTVSASDDTEIYFEITSDLFMPCYSDIEVRRNGIKNDISSLLRRVQILEEHVTELETGGPLYRSYAEPKNIIFTNAAQYIQSGNPEILNNVEAIPITLENCTMIDTSEVEWEIVDPTFDREQSTVATDDQTLLNKKKELIFECSGNFETNEVPEFIDTKTMMYRTNNPNIYSIGNKNATGFYWKVAGDIKGSWAYKYKNYSNEVPIRKKYNPGSSKQNYWGYVGIVPNSLRDKINSGLQALWEIPGKFKGPFNDYNALSTSNAMWNVNFWAYPVDMTCISPCFTRTNNISPTSWTTQHTAITRRHVIGAWHWHMYPGEGNLHFYDRDNNIYFRNVIKQQRIEDTDLVLMMLDEDLPESITPASIINTNDYSKFLTIVTNGWGLLTPRKERGLKCECVHFRHYIARSMWFDIENIDNDDENVTAYTNNSNPYVTGSWYEKSTMVGGDSSSPILLYINGKTVVVEIVHYASGSGANVSKYANLLEKQIQEWGGTTETNLYWLDLSDYD